MDVVALAQIGLRQRGGHAGHGLHRRARAEAVPLHRRGGVQLRRRRRRPPRRRPRAGSRLPHATDTRSVRFLFLPPEHDPDCYVRELGAEAFETLRGAGRAAVAPAASSMPAEGCDLATAEGRARMLAQARPLWQALPDGALRRQLLPELARQAQLRAGRPGRAVGPGAQRPGTAARPPRGAARARHPARAPRERPARRAPAGLADLALRLLLRHSDWWERLQARTTTLLHELGGAHGEVIAWLEQQITEHGAADLGRARRAMAERGLARRRRAPGSKRRGRRRGARLRGPAARAAACGSNALGEDGRWPSPTAAPTAEGLARLRAAARAHRRACKAAALTRGLIAAQPGERRVCGIIPACPQRQE